MLTIYFAFWSLHEHANGHVKVTASSVEKAIEIFKEKYGDNYWGFYGWYDAIPSYNLRQIDSLVEESVYSA